MYRTLKSSIVRRHWGSMVGAAALALLAFTTVARADDAAPAASTDSTTIAAVTPASAPASTEQPTVALTSPFAKRVIDDPIQFQYFRPHDARALNMFEPPKVAGVPYTGNKLDIGVAFTQQYQSLAHANNANAVMVNVGGVPTNSNQLIGIGTGFNNAEANMYIDAQLAKGIRVTMTSYLSSRHHNETWVKDGYILIDESPIDNPLLDGLMKYTTLRVGHFEINYGDAHFRRTDNGSAMFNPFVGNLIMDAFTTEVGAEAYLRAHGLLGMIGATGGEIRGQVTRPDDRAPTFLAKAGFDREVAPATRIRLTGSLYTTKKSVNNTLYSGSRSGSRYYDVLENTQSTEAANAWSGDIQPGLRSKITAMVLNPFVRFHGVELFGNFEQAKGRAANELNERTWHQNSGEALYRFYKDQFYVGGRYNVVKGSFAGMTKDVKVDRSQIAAGWFVTPKILSKVEYVKQNYFDFPRTDIRSGGQFHGLMVEGVVTF